MSKAGYLLSGAHYIGPRDKYKAKIENLARGQTSKLIFATASVRKKKVSGS